METIVHSQQVNVSAKKINAVNSKVQTNKISDFWNNAEFNRFGIIPMLLAFIACTGGFATAFGAYSDTLRLSMVVFPTMIALALMLAVAPMKAIIYASTFAIILDLLILIF